MNGLAWYRATVCRPLGHTHGELEELACIAKSLDEVQAERPAAATRKDT